ncbi:hypothetical protein GTW37_05050 [Streptomyces sp. SID4931]|nr:hypothetical protein [Streptomyces sp. SID4931]SCF69100.1 hypothetical protein GA0115255_1030014 [Streptomyces sp. Ncost-T6T-2b]
MAGYIPKGWMRDDSAGWTYGETSPGGLPTRFKVDAERVNRVYEDQMAHLVADAEKRGMTLLEYVGWVARLSDSEMFVYRDRVRAGVGGQELYDLYDAWLEARTAVQVTQTLIDGTWWPPEEK